MNKGFLDLLLRLAFPVAAAGIVWMASNLYGLRQSVSEIRLSSELKFKAIEDELADVGEKLDRLDVWMDRLNQEFAVVTERQGYFQKHVENHQE